MTEFDQLRDLMDDLLFSTKKFEEHLSISEIMTAIKIIHKLPKQEDCLCYPKHLIKLTGIVNGNQRITRSYDGWQRERSIGSPQGSQYRSNYSLAQ